MKVYPWNPSSLGVMPCLPKDVDPVPAIGLGKAEMEMVAAQLVQFSIDHNQWVGISLKNFACNGDSLREQIVRAIPNVIPFMTRFPYNKLEQFDGIHRSTMGLDGKLHLRTRIGGFNSDIIVGLDLLAKDDYIKISSERDEDVIYPAPKLVGLMKSARDQGDIPSYFGQMPHLRPNTI